MCNAPRFIGTYLVIVGALQLMSFNLLGGLFITCGIGVAKRVPWARTFALWLCALHLLLCAAFLVAALLGAPFTVHLGYSTIQAAPFWISVAVILPFGVLLGLPLYWLTRPGVKIRFLSGRCTQCGYELRGLSRGQCPECGHAPTT